MQVTGLNEVAAIAAAFGVSFALKKDGTVWGWGKNNNWELGDGTSMNRGIPVKSLGLSDVAAISAGYISSLALKRDKTAWEWGWFGNPRKVKELSDVSAIAADFRAVKQDGTVWAWGLNDLGQLGDGTFAFRLTPGVTSRPVSDRPPGAIRG